MKIYFDDVEVSQEAIRKLHLSHKMFNDSFMLGATPCREVDLEVNKEYVTEHPSIVTITKDNDPYMTLYVDEVNEENDFYYSYKLYDNMMKLNTELKNVVPEGIEQNVENILVAICNYIGCDAPEIEYGRDIHIIWNDEQYCRDFISWVAEINCSFAEIDGEGNLIFVKMNRESVDDISIATCKDIKIGDHHIIERVCYEQGTATVYYPEESTEELDTLYLNENNPLFTDTDEYTIQEMVKHIYDEMVGFEFYNLKTTRCQLSEIAEVGDVITFVHPTTSEEYPTIAQLDQDYNTKWKGGYELQVANERQEVTTVKKAVDRLNRVRILVDRAAARIEQVVSDAEGHVGSFALYLNETDDHQVISTINESADNIVLNTKSLIFGEYPDGKYIEVKNIEEAGKEYDTLYIDSMGENGNYVNLFGIFPRTNILTSDDILELTFELLEIKEGEFTPILMTDYTHLSIGCSPVDNYYNITIAGTRIDSEEPFSMDTHIEVNTKYKLIINNTTGMVKLNEETKYFPVKTSSSFSETKLTLFSNTCRYISPSIASYSKIRFYEMNMLTQDDILLHNYIPYFYKEDTLNYIIQETVVEHNFYGEGNFSPSKEKSGVLFSGTGKVQFEPQREYSVYNKDNDTIENSFLVAHQDDGTNNITLTNMSNDIAENQLVMQTNGSNRTIEMRNIRNSQTINDLYMYDNGYAAGVYLGNKKNNSWINNLWIATNDDNDTSIKLTNGILPNGNVIEMSTSEGTTIKNGYSEWHFDMHGNCRVAANNSMVLASDHYNVTIDANNTYTSDAGYIYLKAARDIHLSGRAVYFNGVKKW